MQSDVGNRCGARSPSGVANHQGRRKKRLDRATHLQSVHALSWQPDRPLPARRHARRPRKVVVCARVLLGRRSSNSLASLSTRYRATTFAFYSDNGEFVIESDTFYFIHSRFSFQFNPFACFNAHTR